MHDFTLRRALCMGLALSITGCSGVASTTAPITPGANALGRARLVSQPAARGASFVHSGVPFLPSLLRRAAAFAPAASYVTNKPLVFEADQQEAVVNVYAASALTKNPPPVATLSVPVGCPYGMALDSKADLYVATNCSGNTIEIYHKGKTAPFASLTNGISNPLGLAIDAHDTLYVSNYPASITEYPSGKKSPSKTITGQGLSDPFGLALDKHGNLFVADFGAAQVFEIAAGTTTVTPLGLQDLTEPLGVAVDKRNGDLWVTDGEGDRVNVYPAGSTKPSHTITAGYNEPYAIASEPQTGATVVSNLYSPADLIAYQPNAYTSFATLTNGIELPTGVLWAKP